MKESFRLRMDGISRGYKLIFIATRKAKPDFKRQDFEAEINNLLTEAGLFAKTNQPAD